MFSHDVMVNEIGRLHKFALRLTRNTHNADDLVQATVLRALEKSDLFVEGTNFFGWASKIMFNIFISQYRRKTKFETQYDPEDFLNKLCSEPKQEIVVDLKKVTRAIERLSKDHRQILEMACIEGMLYEEVAEELDIPVGTVRSRIARARSHLHTLLEEQEFRLNDDETMPLPAIAKTSGQQQAVTHH